MIFGAIKVNVRCQSNSVINKVKINNFKYFLKNIPWTDLLSNEDASEAYDFLISKFTDLPNIAFRKKGYENKNKEFNESIDY